MNSERPHSRSYYAVIPFGYPKVEHSQVISIPWQTESEVHPLSINSSGNLNNPEISSFVEDKVVLWGTWNIFRGGRRREMKQCRHQDQDTNLRHRRGSSDYIPGIEFHSTSGTPVALR